MEKKKSNERNSMQKTSTSNVTNPGRREAKDTTRKEVKPVTMVTMDWHY
jgi:hypothetical protein